MPDEPPTYWFPAKEHGWGWGRPRRWQGWLVMAVCTGVVLATVVLSRDPSMSLPVLVVATGLLTLVCLRKGEPPGWRWGSE